MEKLDDDLHDKIKTLEDKNFKLQTKWMIIKKTTVKFKPGQENLDKLLCTKKTSFNKEGIGYNYSSKKKSYKNFFVKPTFHKKDVRICNYFSKLGHMIYSCPL